MTPSPRTPRPRPAAALRGGPGAPDDAALAGVVEELGPFWAKITGQAAGTNRYAWTQIDEGDTAAFDTGLAGGFAAAGTSATDGAPAYEVNGRQDVPVGARVKLWPAGDFTYYTFEYTKSGVAGTGTDNHVTRWDGTTAIQDSTATIDDTGTLTVYGAAGAGAGLPRTTVGSSGPTSKTAIVTLNPVGSGGAQETATLTAAALGAGSTLYSSNWTAQFTDGGGGGNSATLQLVTLPLHLRTGYSDRPGVITAGVANGSAGSCPVVCEYALLGGDTTDAGAKYTAAGVEMGSASNFGTDYNEFYIAPLDPTNRTTRVCVWDKTLGKRTGATGSVGAFAVTGGIVTSLPAAFGDAVLAANQTFTGADTFHPSTDLVPVTLQGGGAGTADLLVAKNAAGATVFSVSAAGVVTGNGSGLTNIGTGGLTPAAKAQIVAMAGAYLN